VTEAERAEALLREISELYAIVLRVARRVHEGDDPMTATQRLALIEIAAVGPIRLRSLAARMETTPATATRAVDALEERRFVRRQADPDDRRGVLVVATARGRRWSDRRRAVLREVIEQVTERDAPPRLVGDLRTLNAALRGLTGHNPLSQHEILVR
jgi:DNA-binding MarR family transcriptional regulator